MPGGILTGGEGSGGRVGRGSDGTCTHALDEHLLQALVRAAHAAAVDRGAAGAISHFRQVSLVAGGSAWFPASGIFQYSVGLKTPGAFKSPEGGSVLCRTPRSLDLQDARFRGGDRHQAVEDLHRPLSAH